jgi:hypothetical protein
MMKMLCCTRRKRACTAGGIYTFLDNVTVEYSMYYSVTSYQLNMLE